jgi:hypothetical protein
LNFVLFLSLESKWSNWRHCYINVLLYTHGLSLATVDHDQKPIYPLNLPSHAH